MKKIILQILVVLLLAISIPAQTEEKKPILIDEFGKTSDEDTFARLDRLINELSQRPDAKAVIRIYGENENCFLCNYRRGSWITGILKNVRKVPSEKYAIEYCNEVTEAKTLTQLYLLPPMANLPKCEETVEIPKQSALFDKIHFYYKDNKLSPLEALIEVVGPAHGEYSQSALAVVKKILESSPESKIYILAYLGTNLEYDFDSENDGEPKKRTLDKKSLAKKMLLIAKNELIKNGISSAQIITDYGGYVDDKRRLEFWFVPKGGEIPKRQLSQLP